eukprot:COSAG01_NODE_32235_length_584_cov_1.164948_1_plen_76_part_01
MEMMLLPFAARGRRRRRCVCAAPLSHYCCVCCGIIIIETLLRPLPAGYCPMSTPLKHVRSQQNSSVAGAACHPVLF